MGPQSASHHASAPAPGDRTELDRLAFAVLVSLTTPAIPLHSPLLSLKADGPITGTLRQPAMTPPAAVATPAPVESLSLVRDTVAGSTGRPGTVCPAVPGRTAADHASSLGLIPAPATIFVRCVSCRASLALPALLSKAASAVEWLSKQRPYMLSCPGCQKTLPHW